LKLLDGREANLGELEFGWAQFALILGQHHRQLIGKTLVLLQLGEAIAAVLQSNGSREIANVEFSFQDSRLGLLGGKENI
jgi:hypothetical protein